MATVERTPPRTTHIVENQPPPLESYNLYAGDTPLQEAVRREGADWAQERLQGFGAEVGGEPMRWGEEANINLPVLHTHDRFGNRLDEVEYHPSWHRLLALGVERELHALPWNDRRAGAHSARAALFMLLAQAEAGVMCPLSMTFSGVPALEASPEIEAEWRPRFTLADYERGALCGMALTEKQGGSDVGANTTLATPIGDGEYELTGHKWFCSSPMCDAFLVTARTPGAAEGSGGLSCFLLPRVFPDGTRNRMYMMRLKDKLGTRSLATAEVEYDAALAFLVGEEGRGIPTIMKMVNHNRLDATLGSAAGIRRAVVEAIYYTAHREAFGRTLIDQPLMRNVLADLCLESEAATAAALRLARAFDDAEAAGGRRDAERPLPDSAEAFRRLVTAVVKYHICKRGPAVAVEALECWGGNGYVEDSVMSHIYRDSQVNSTWEGSGNVIALDVLRTLAKEPESRDAFMVELESARGADSHLDVAIDDVRASLDGLIAGDPQYRARSLVDRMALTLEAVLLVRGASEGSAGADAVAKAFIATRLAGDAVQQLGTLPPGVDCEAIIERSRPQL